MESLFYSRDVEKASKKIPHLKEDKTTLEEHLKRAKEKGVDIRELAKFLREISFRPFEHERNIRFKIKNKELPNIRNIEEYKEISKKEKAALINKFNVEEEEAEEIHKIIMNYRKLKRDYIDGIYRFSPAPHFFHIGSKILERVFAGDEEMEKKIKKLRSVDVANALFVSRIRPGAVKKAIEIRRRGGNYEKPKNEMLSSVKKHLKDIRDMIRVIEKVRE